MPLATPCHLPLATQMNGDLLAQLMMHVIRFVLPSKNKALKKLLLFYWEICPKHNPDGKLKQEMILVWYVQMCACNLSNKFTCVMHSFHAPCSPCHDYSNYLRNDLQSSNEYVRGMTLRFLCKLREQELLEPLLPSCRTSLVGVCQGRVRCVAMHCERFLFLFCNRNIGTRMCARMQ